MKEWINEYLCEQYVHKQQATVPLWPQQAPGCQWRRSNWIPSSGSQVSLLQKWQWGHLRVGGGCGGGGSGAKQGTERVGRAGSKGRLSHKANNNYVECFLHSDQIILITPGVKINMLPSQICNYAYLIAIVIKCTLFDRTPTRGRTHIPAHILVNELKALWQNEVWSPHPNCLLCANKMHHLLTLYKIKGHLSHRGNETCCFSMSDSFCHIIKNQSMDLLFSLWRYILLFYIKIKFTD